MNKTANLTVLFFILTAVNIFAFGSKESSAAGGSLYSSPPPIIAQQTVREQTRAEQVMRALAEAYPRQIDRAEFRNNDWAVLMRGTWYTVRSLFITTALNYPLGKPPTPKKRRVFAI